MSASMVSAETSGSGERSMAKYWLSMARKRPDGARCFKFSRRDKLVMEVSVKEVQRNSRKMLARWKSVNAPKVALMILPGRLRLDCSVGQPIMKHICT